MYVFCIVPGMAKFLQPLKVVVHWTLSPALLEIPPPSDALCDVFVMFPFWRVGFFNLTMQCSYLGLYHAASNYVVDGYDGIAVLLAV